jgi:hypothetical protein
MLHLFNKTYLEVDSFIDPNVDRIVISELSGLNLLENLKQLYIGRLFAYGATLADVVGSDKVYPTFADMLDFCFEFNKTADKKIVIYCDKAAYMTLSSMWFKMNFQEIDSTSAYKIIKASFAKDILLGGKNVHNLEDEYLTALPSQLEYHNAFELATVDTASLAGFMSKTVESKSIEYMMASYFVDGGYKDQLKKSIRFMINRHVEVSLYEVWKSIQTNILRKSIQEALLTEEYSLDNILDMVNDNRLTTLKSTNTWRSLGGIGQIRTAMDITSLNDAQTDQLKDQVSLIMGKLLGIGEDKIDSHIQRTNFYIDIVRKATFSDLDFNSVIDFELNASDDVRFWCDKDRDNINTYFLDFVIEAKRNSQVYLLAAYKLK